LDVTKPLLLLHSHSLCKLAANVGHRTAAGKKGERKSVGKKRSYNKTQSWYHLWGL
jgi:hypothetical protein